MAELDTLGIKGRRTVLAFSEDDASRRLNVDITGRSNKGMNATAHSVSLMFVASGGALSPAFGGWWRNRELKGGKPNRARRNGRVRRAGRGLVP